MKIYSQIGISLTLLLLTIPVSESNAYTFWRSGSLNITSDRAIYINSGCTADQQARIYDACKAWLWTCVRFRPYVAGITTRAPGTRDNHNVIGNDNGNNSWLGLTTPWDNSVDECDVRINTGEYTWHVGTHWTMPTLGGQYTYQGTATHEIGHVMGLGHSSENEAETNPLFRNATMYYQEDHNSSTNVTLNKDDLLCMQARNGFMSLSWKILNNPGYDVRIPKNSYEVQLYIDPMGQGYDWDDWVVIRNDLMGGWVDSDTRIEWEEYDKAHSAIVNPYVVGVDGIGRDIFYARNAPNWYSNANHIGWPDMSAFPESYNQWVSITKSLWVDYRAEYGVDPAYVQEVRIIHFVNTSWVGDHGCSVRSVRIRGAESN